MTALYPAGRVGDAAPKTPRLALNVVAIPSGWRDPLWAGISFSAGVATTIALIGMVRTLARWLLA